MPVLLPVPPQLAIAPSKRLIWLFTHIYIRNILNTMRGYNLKIILASMLTILTKAAKRVFYKHTVYESHEVL